MTYIHGAGGGSQPKQPKQKAPPKPIITQDDANLRSVSFAKIQYLLCEGEIEGPAEGNSIEGLERSVYLDDTPVRVGGSPPSPQPEDLVFSWGRPNQSQTGVPDYNRTSETVSVDREVKPSTPIIQRVDGVVVGGTYYARVLLTFQALYLTIVDGDGAPVSGPTGSIKTYKVEYKVRYTDSTGTVREPFFGNVEGKFGSSFQRSHEFLLEGPGPWDVEVQRTTPDDKDAFGGDSRVEPRSAFNFSTVILSLDQKFSFPHSSMLTVGVRADNYSELPNVSVLLKGMKIQVPSNYNPTTRVYTGTWNGTWQTVYSDNPAWVLRDMVINDRYGVGQYIDSNSIDRWSLYEIAKYCDEQVPDGNGGTEPRFTCNLLLQSGAEAWEVLQQLSSIFRGLVYYASEIAVAVQDRVKDPVFTFSESNTIADISDDGKVDGGNFVYAGAARRAIHTVALVSWDDPDNNFETRIEYVTNDRIFSKYGYRPIDLRLLGVTSRGQALRAANWALLSEELLTDTCTFRVNEIGMGIRPGDIVKIADPAKGAVRLGGRILKVDGKNITIDKAPNQSDWTGAKISWMYSDSTDQPQLQEASITSRNDNVITIDDDGGNTPVATFPWLIEFPNKTAQLFRVLGVGQEEEGVFEIAALRYREDIYSAVDNDTPLQEDDSYLYKPVNPSAPTNVTAEVVWDNSQAKIDVRWKPPVESVTLFGYDLTVTEYRIQWQSGTVNDDGAVTWSESWKEIPRQIDDRELIPLEELSIVDKFRVRLAAVSRLGVQSSWSDVVVATDIDVANPMPDISLKLPNGEDVLTFQNQSSGAQLFRWQFSGLVIPPYVTGMRLDVLPNRPLTPGQQKGLSQPDADGRYIYGDYPLEDYAVAVFHSDTNWLCRVSFLTAVDGLFGKTYAAATVDRNDLVPPPPDLFTVVTETLNKSIAPLRRFSWSLPTQGINDDPSAGVPGPPTPPPAGLTPNWPLGKVTDITQFLVRYKAGLTTQWDLAVPLFADGVPGDQRYFETEAFDSGTWTVMIRSVDRTGWISDNQASIIVNLGDPIPTNVVEDYEPHVDGWPGQKVNLEISVGSDYDNSHVDCEPPVGTWLASDVINDAGDSICTDEPTYNSPEFDAGTAAYDNADLQPRSEINKGEGDLIQIDPTKDGYYFYPFDVTASDGGILVTTISNGTYQWSLRKIGSDLDDPMYPDPQSDPMYPSPQSDYMYLNTTRTIGKNYHPYVPFEILDSGSYELACRVRSIDGVAKTSLSVTTVQIDYPDIRQSIEDLSVPASDQNIKFPDPFPNKVKAINITLQDPAGSVTVPATAYVRGKTRDGFDLRLLDADGAIVEGLVDVVAVGY